MKITSSSILAATTYSAIVFNATVRSELMILLGVSFPDINFAFILGVLFFVSFRVYEGLSKQQLGLIGLVIVYFFLGSATNLLNGNMDGLRVLLFSIIPGLLLLSVLDSSINYMDAFLKFRLLYNYLVIPVLCIGILDYFLGGVVNQFIATHLSSVEWAAMINTENATFGFRMCTIIGSPLMNGFYALTLLSINLVRVEKGKMNIGVVILLGVFSIVAIVLTGSRTALILACIVFLLKCFQVLSRLQMTIVALAFIALILALFHSTMFQSTVGGRFQNDMLQDGRFSMLAGVLSGKYGIPGLIFGGGYNFSRSLTATGMLATQNFELPILMFLFDYGVVATFLYYLLLFIYPIVEMLRRHRYQLFTSFLVLAVDLNSFNVLAQKYDFTLLIAGIASLLIGLSYQLKTDVRFNQRGNL